MHEATTAWPAPRLDTSVAASANVYRGEVIIFATFRVSEDATPGVAELRGTLHVGVCRETCEPKRERFSLTLGVDTVPPELSPAWQMIETDAAPTRLAPLDHRFVRASFDRDSVRLTIQLPGGPPSGTMLTFFPAERTRAAVIVRAHTTHDNCWVRLPLEARDGVGRIAGVLATPVPWGLQGPSAVAVDTHVYGMNGVQ